MPRKSRGLLLALGLSAFTLAATAAAADPVVNAGHQVAQTTRRGAHEVANAGRDTGHVVAATGRHVKHDLNGTSDQYNDHPGHAGYWRHHRHYHRHHYSRHHYTRHH
jgi:hypothetical protein